MFMYVLSMPILFSHPMAWLGLSPSRPSNWHDSACRHVAHPFHQDTPHPTHHPVHPPIIQPTHEPSIPSASPHAKTSFSHHTENLSCVATMLQSFDRHVASVTHPPTHPPTAHTFHDIGHQIALPLHRHSVSLRLMKANVAHPTDDISHSRLKTSAIHVHQQIDLSHPKQVTQARSRTKVTELVAVIFSTTDVPHH